MTDLSSTRWRLLRGVAVAGVLAMLPGVLLGTGAPAARAAVRASVRAATPPAATPTWSVVSPPVSPPPLAFAATAYDSDNGTVVLFGGRGGDGSVSSDTWVWDGSTWSQVTSSVPARAGAAMAFDPALHQLILFGGTGAGGQLLSDTWAWNGASWFALTPSASPPPRTDAAMAFDNNDQLVLFGGTGAGPTASALPAAALAAPGLPSIVGPVAGAVGAATGPAALGDTWAWTGSSWVQQQAPGPSPRTDAAVGWDGVHHSTVLFGGSTVPAGPGPPAGLLADTWAWGGGTWGVAASPTAPSPREGTTLASDGDLGGLVAFGGSGSAGPDGDTWLWTGQAWQLLSPIGAPAPRVGAAAAFDRAAHQLVLFGGVGPGGAVLGDTEILTLRAPTVAAGSAGGSGPATDGSSARTSTSTSPAKATGSIAGRGGTRHARAESAPTPALRHVSARHVRRGDLVTLAGSGFRAGTTITITFHSTPSLVGRTNADATGRFSATVAVPTAASMGEHHFEAVGLGRSGNTIILVTPIDVVSAIAQGSSIVQALVLILLAIALPAGTWLTMELAGRRRRRPSSLPA